MKKVILIWAALGLATACVKKGGDSSAPPAAPPAKAQPAPSGPSVAQPGDEASNSGTPAPNDLQAAVMESYTSAAGDYLNQKLTAKLRAEENLKVRDSRVKRARSIRDAHLLTNGDGSFQVVVDIPEISNAETAQTSAPEAQSVRKEIQHREVRPRSNKKEAILIGRFGLPQEKVSLRAINPYSRALNLSGSLTCLGFGRGGCQTAIATLFFGGEKSEKVDMIFRTTSTFFELKVPRTKNSDPLYRDFVKLFSYSMYGASPRTQGTDTLRRRQMNSFEIIGGRAGVEIFYQTYSNEVIAFRAPLVAIASDSMIIPAEKLTALEIGRSLREREVYTTYMDGISDILLVENNGRGKLSFSMTMSALAGEDSDRVLLTLSPQNQKANP